MSDIGYAQRNLLTTWARGVEGSQQINHIPPPFSWILRTNISSASRSPRFLLQALLQCSVLTTRMQSSDAFLSSTLNNPSAFDVQGDTGASMTDLHLCICFSFLFYTCCTSLHHCSMCLHIVQCTVQCAMYLTLHSFSLKLCSATIDLKTQCSVQHISNKLILVFLIDNCPS